MNIKQISLIEPKPEQKNIFSHLKEPRIGLTLLATILKDKGYRVKVFFESRVPIDWNYVYQSDICGITTLTEISELAYAISARIKQRNIPVVLGGPHASLMPDEALQNCDYVVRGEGEISFPELLDALKNGSDLSNVKGISYKKDGKNIHNPPSELIDMDIYPSPDLSLIHEPQKTNIILSYIKFSFLSTTRGCPHNCEFCSIIPLFGRRYRMRSIPNIIKDIRELIRQRNPNVIFFVDDNFVANKQRTVELLNEIIKNNFNIRLCTQIRASAALDEELLKLMKKAGFYLVFIGFESISQDTLDEYNKNIVVEEMVQGIKNLKKHDIYIHGMFIFGSDSDNPGSVDETVDFCLKHGIDSVQLFSLTPLPGTRLTDKLASESRILPIPTSWLDGQRASILSKNIRPSRLIWDIYKGYNKFYSLRRAWKLLIQNGWNSYAFLCNIYAFFWLKFMLVDCLKRMKFSWKHEKGRYKGNTLIN